MSEYEHAMQKLKESGSLNLSDLKLLKLEELEKLEHEIQFWCLYGNGRLDAFGRSSTWH